MAQVALCGSSVVAERFGVSRETVRRWALTGVLVPVVTTPGGHRRYSVADVDALASREDSSHESGDLGC
ncbi:helix-turn-helix domain-containing protein [Williamsia muralis]|uniref:MerR family transcriptional regulator n=1 Tax=Williamsia marianensis TaxID=85044 RepID=UPI000E32B470|nr:helix-turn-helix domain-containing protein [Williamsia marianensis]